MGEESFDCLFGRMWWIGNEADETGADVAYAWTWIGLLEVRTVTSDGGTYRRRREWAHSTSHRYPRLVSHYESLDVTYDCRWWGSLLAECSFLSIGYLAKDIDEIVSSTATRKDNDAVGIHYSSPYVVRAIEGVTLWLLYILYFRYEIERCCVYSCPVNWPIISRHARLGARADICLPSAFLSMIDYREDC